MTSYTIVNIKKLFPEGSKFASVLDRLLLFTDPFQQYISEFEEAGMKFRFQARFKMAPTGQMIFWDDPDPSMVNVVGKPHVGFPSLSIEGKLNVLLQEFFQAMLDAETAELRTVMSNRYMMKIKEVYSDHISDRLKNLS